MTDIERPPTQLDVAQAAGVSRALVSIAFRGVKGISPETRDHILTVAERMGYRPNAVAARLASKHTVTIGVFLLDLYNEIFADMYEGIRSVTEEGNHHVVLAIGASGGHRDTPAMDNLLRARADVIIAGGLMLPDETIQRLNRSAPIVNVARAVPEIDSVYPDDIDGALQAVEHLYKLGHRRIAHIASPARQGYTGRRTGYEQAMWGHKLAPLTVAAEYNQESAARVAAQLLSLEDPPTAIFANNDVAALGVLDVLDAMGLRVGEDVSVVGYDNTPVAHLPAISLTSIDLHAKQLGVDAARIALQRVADPMSEPQHLSSKPELVVRRSTQPPRSI
ncbi:LacI family DNA-binding transcriptional regulator [Humibacter ginsengiterrae]